MVGWTGVSNFSCYFVDFPIDLLLCNNSSVFFPGLPDGTLLIEPYCYAVAVGWAFHSWPWTTPPLMVLPEGKLITTPLLILIYWWWLLLMYCIIIIIAPIYSTLFYLWWGRFIDWRTEEDIIGGYGGVTVVVGLWDWLFFDCYYIVIVLLLMILPPYCELHYYLG